MILKRQVIGWMLMLAVTGIGCQNNEIASASMEEELSPKNNAGRAATDVSVNAYTDTSAYINSGFSFLNPSQIDKTVRR